MQGAGWLAGVMEFWALFLPTVVGIALWWAGMERWLHSIMPKLGVAILALWGLLILVGAVLADELLPPGGFPLFVLGLPAIVNLFAAVIAAISLKNALKRYDDSGSKENQ